MPLLAKTEKPRDGLAAIILLQSMVVLFTFSGVFGKLATDGNALFSSAFVLYVGLDIMVLAAYALGWQQALKRFDLHVAYANRATSTVWSLLWAYCIFHESITVWNVVGTAIIIAGIFLINDTREEQH